MSIRSITAEVKVPDSGAPPPVEIDDRDLEKGAGQPLDGDATSNRLPFYEIQASFAHTSDVIVD